MTMKKTAIIACLAFFCASVPGLGGCGSGGDAAPIAEEAAGGTADAGAAAATAENIPYMGYVFPDIDYGGYEFRITSMVFDMDGAINEIVTEKENGDLINDAIYRRNLLVEEKLNISITNTQLPMGQMRDIIKRSAAAADDAFGVAFCNIMDSASLANTGIFVNLFDIPALEVRAPWWNQKIINDVSIGNKLYFCVSDITIQPNQLAWIIYFNKTMMKELDLKEPYELARSGAWTIDAMMELMKKAIYDLNGDGAFSRGDRFGFIAHNSSSNAFLKGADIKPIIKDERDYPMLTHPSERDNYVADKLKELFEPKYGNYLAVDQGIEALAFMNREALFVSNNMVIIDVIRDMDDDFGLLPYPKPDAQQDSYYSNLGMNSASFGIPSTAPDIERIGVVVNALTAVSIDTVRPAYFEYTLKRKRARDDESLDMLELIASGRVFDVGLVYNWGNIVTEYRENVVKCSSASLFTVFEKYSGPAQSAIDKSLKAFMEMD